MAAMPLAHSGLLAVAVKFTGELLREPVAGDVTVTTGVVAKAVKLRVSNMGTSTRGRRSRAQFTIKTSQPSVGCRDASAICNATFYQTIGSIPKRSRFHSLGVRRRIDPRPLH
jgi:hypothetical protein